MQLSDFFFTCVCSHKSKHFLTSATVHQPYMFKVLLITVHHGNVKPKT